MFQIRPIGVLVADDDQGDLGSDQLFVDPLPDLVWSLSFTFSIPNVLAAGRLAILADNPAVAYLSSPPVVAAVVKSERRTSRHRTLLWSENSTRDGCSFARWGFPLETT